MSSIKAISTLALITIISLAFIGCSSDDSSSVAPTTVDTAPPAVPANLEATYYDGTLTLTWAENTTDADLAGFIIERDYYGDVTELQASPGLGTSFEDSPLMGLNVYNVYSVDLTGNQSAVASVEYHRTGRHLPDEEIDLQF